MAAVPVVNNRKRRLTCWWEPTYNPSLVGAMISDDWGENSKGPTRHFIEGENLASVIAQNGGRAFEGYTFCECDFQGFFTSTSQIVFKTCNFINCDFGLTTWINVKFSNCEFRQTSFGMTVFNSCEFRDCEWEQIGLSPNELVLDNTFINNPTKFIRSGYTNLDRDVLKEKRKTWAEQTSKLETTKATVARQLLKNMGSTGDERSYYEAVKIFETQQAKGRLYSALYDIVRKQQRTLWRLLAFAASAYWLLEIIILRTIGTLNAWGASVAKPIVILVSAAYIYYWIYFYCGSSIPTATPFQRTLDIAMLAGFGNYSTETRLITRIIQNTQLVLSTLLYTVTFSTILSRFSRVR